MKFHKMSLASLFAVSLLVICQGAPLLAQEDDSRSRTIKILGRSEVTVTTPEIRLGDIANISSRFVADDDAVIGLKKIYMKKSPGPGKSITISAAQAIERMREEGVVLGKVGYAFPRVMKIARASRAISGEEVRSAIEEALLGMGGEVELRGIEYRKLVHVAPGILELQSESADRSLPGKMTFALSAEVNGEKPVRFTVNAIVDEWVKIPVASRPLMKGSIVSSRDVAMARLNLGSLPPDAEHEVSSIIGLETSHNITHGEVFRKKKLNIPAVIEAGARVTMIYESKRFRATASGIAVESGIAGQSIRVRNDASKRIVTGEIVEPGLVRISQ